MRIFWTTFAPQLPSDVLAGGALAGALLLLLPLLLRLVRLRQRQDNSSPQRANE
jgi:membrane-associated phospholipid phosphatase